MALTFNGVGTTLYGQRHLSSDGSYISTEWFVVLFFPVFPLRSLIVLPKLTPPKPLAPFELSAPQHYTVLGEVPLIWWQVVYAYVSTSGILAFIAWWALDSVWGAGLVFALWPAVLVLLCSAKLKKLCRRPLAQGEKIVWWSLLALLAIIILSIIKIL